MKQYPHIQYYPKGIMGEPVYAFDKLDGSCMRAEWSKKRGWCKFGSRTQMIDENNQQFGMAIKLFKVQYADDLDQIFRKKEEYRNSQEFVVYFEYFGDKSFAGYHVEGDKMFVRLFDVDQYKRGIIPAREFVDNFSHLLIPKIIYIGNLNHDFIQRVKDNEFGLKEGVVCKGVRKTKGKDLIWMVKIKTADWLKRLKSLGDDKVALELAGEAKDEILA